MGLKSADIWERIVEQRLPGFCPLGTGNLKPVFLSGADLRRHINHVKQERHLLNYHEIALRFKVKSTVVARWIDNGLLTPSLKIGAAEYFTQAEVDDFCANHIFTEQAAEILEVVSLHAIMYQGFTPIMSQRFTPMMYHPFTPMMYQ